MELIVTKEANLINNDGFSVVNGLSAQQHHNAFRVFYNFLNEVRPARILEIGTALGGFTEFLKKVSDDINYEIDILSFDIHEKPWYKDIVARGGVKIVIENIFGQNFSSVKQEVIDFIQSEGTTIVLCDGGYKVGEFNILSKYIKRGDFILAHDYAENREVFERNINGKIWNWCEITESDIEESVIENNLKSYQSDKFAQVVWVCKTK